MPKTKSAKQTSKKKVAKPLKVVAPPPKKRQFKLSRKGFVVLILIGLIGLGGYLYNRYASRALDVYPNTLSASYWQIDKHSTNHQIEGYASATSVFPGSVINFMISCKNPQNYKADIYKMGYSEGRGATYISALSPRPCRPQSLPNPDKDTGLVNLDWPVSFRLHVPSGWSSGVYLMKLAASDGFQSYVPFVVKPTAPTAKYLFVHSSNTDNAYNIWGGNSLYSGYTPDLKISRAVKVSFNRPLKQPGSNFRDGAGDFLHWEYPMVRFLDKNSYKVDYVSDVDIHEHPEMLLKYKTVILTGHNEYWSLAMLNGYTKAIQSGVNLAVFAANTAYRPVRFEPDPYTGEPDRIMVDYKNAGLDPLHKDPANQNQVTAYSWRAKPLLRPESQLLGIAYRNETADEGTASADLVVNDDSSWIFNGTELKKGDAIKGVLGYEYEQYTDAFPHPANVSIVFHSPLTNQHGNSDFADADYYKLPEGGQLFNAGTMQWSWGLDETNPDYSPQLVKITQNILDRFGK